MGVAWYRVEYKEGKVTAYRAYGSEGRAAWFRRPPEWEDRTNFRETGTFDVKKEPPAMRPGVVFFPDIVGTIGLVRIYGYLSPAWLEANNKEAQNKLAQAATAELSNVQVTGDTATGQLSVPIGGSGTSIRFRKIDGRWLIEL